ncbi:MAG: hypothetical protein DI537_42720 [Stutzerimonas stutzeri]|nr:MAG: hypothetical protein DI537_42720 [Stutzerimonas stutzeri]
MSFIGKGPGKLPDKREAFGDGMRIGSGIDDQAGIDPDQPPPLLLFGNPPRLVSCGSFEYG